MVGLGERPGFSVAFLAVVEHPEGGRRQDAKRPEKRGAGGFASGPRFLFGGEGAALGAAPSPAKRRRPQAVLPIGRGKGAPGSFMVRLACVDLTGPVELFQQHHPEELVGKGGRPKGNALIRPAQNGVRKP